MIRFAIAIVVVCATTTQAAGPSVADALAFEPIQPNVDYDRPTGSEAQGATIKAEQDGKTTAWVVRSASGQMLRRFADTNADNMVDQWSYYQNGLEVYRDIDANFNGKADQYRWMHTGGTRWGLDTNEDGSIDTWRAISLQEVAELAVAALASRDAAKFQTLLPTAREIQSAGLGKAAADQLLESTKAAASGFAKFAADQKVVSSGAKFLDVGSSRPGVVPAGTDGSTSDITYYENVTALVDNGGKPEQVYLGQFVQVAGGWRLTSLPQLGGDSAPAGTFSFAASTMPANAGGGGSVPTDEMQKLMDDLYRLESQAEATPPAQLDKLTDRRVELLTKIAEVSPADQRSEWLGQLADMLSAAVSTHGYAKGIPQLERLAADLRKQRASSDLIAHVEFRRIWAEYGLAQRDPKADVAKIQNNWLEALEKFAGDYPNSPDAAEAMLQLGMGNEFAGETDTAIEWYGKLSKQFANTSTGSKAAGAIRRLESIGNVIPLTGRALDGSQVDLRAYRGKAVVVQYWATWCGPCKDDMEKLKQLYAQYNRNGFEVIGVNLDTSAEVAKNFVASSRVPWKQIAEGDGLDGRLANEMGVNTLPLMVMIGPDGKVTSRSLYITEVEDEIKRLLAK
jgi:thiol-disulfide isomerase/thioredoxin